MSILPGPIAISLDAMSTRSAQDRAGNTYEVIRGQLRITGPKGDTLLVIDPPARVTGFGWPTDEPDRLVIGTAAGQLSLKMKVKSSG